MSLVTRLKRILGYRPATGDEDSYVCLSCGTELDRDYHDCPECGNPYVVPREPGEE